MTLAFVRSSRRSHADTDLRGIAYLAGHRDLVTTSRYVHGDVYAAERVLRAVAQLMPRETAFDGTLS